MEGGFRKVQQEELCIRMCTRSVTVRHGYHPQGACIFVSPGGWVSGSVSEWTCADKERAKRGLGMGIGNGIGNGDWEWEVGMGIGNGNRKCV